MFDLSPMNKTTKTLFEIIVGGALPVFFFLLFWFTSVCFTDNIKTVAILALSGLTIGLVLALMASFYWKLDVFLLSPWVMLTVYIFYSLCMFGFFMGVPLLHPMLGLIAGAYWANRMIYRDIPAEQYPTATKKVSFFTALVMGGICVLSASAALASTSTPSDLKGMLQLPFVVTMPMIATLILIGGTFLVVIQYWLTKMIMTRILKP